MSSINFKQLIADSDIPTTESGLLQRLRQIATEEGVIFNNTCEYSPFWRLTTLFMVRPLLWLINLLSDEILPALFLKTATGQWVDTFAWQLGLERKAATQARGAITLTRNDVSGVLMVPAGTVIQSAPINNRVYRLVTLADHSFNIGDRQCTVITQAEEAGTAYNLATGFYAIMSTSLAGITGVKNNKDWLLVPGSDRESDDELKARCRIQFTAINQWHIDAAYTAMVTRWAGIDVQDVYIEKDAPRGPGTANIYILFEQDAPATEYIQQIQNYIMNEGNHGFSDDVLVQPMPTQLIDVSAKIVLPEHLTQSQRDSQIKQISDFIKVALRALPPTDYHPTRAQPHSRFVWSRLIMELHQQFGDLISIDFKHDQDLLHGLSVPKLNHLEVSE